MNDTEFSALRATFPWTERLTTVPGAKGGVVQVLDRHGREVPLFTMTRFLTYITTRLTQATAASQPQPEKPQP